MQSPSIPFNKRRADGEILKLPDVGPRPKVWGAVWKSGPVLVFASYRNFPNWSGRRTENRGVTESTR
jgi:hypothetical protein